MPTAMERLIWGFGDGSTLPVVDTPVGRVGSVICWENYMPMLRMAMYAKGVQVYCASTVDDRDVWPAAMRHIAFEGRCFVLSACQYIRRGAYPADYPAIQGDDPQTVMIRGGSCIVGPLGEFIVGAALRGGSHPERRDRPRADRGRQVRPGRGRALRPAGRLQALRQRKASGGGRVHQRRRQRPLRGEIAETDILIPIHDPAVGR